MSHFSIFKLFLFLHFGFLSYPSSLHGATSTPPPRGFHINCGSNENTGIGGIDWITDEGFISTGNTSQINTPGVTPILSTVRYFPEKSAPKYCYVVPVSRGSKYLIRTTYFYGGFDGGKDPPVFDQIVGGTKWSTVNTTENYAKGLSAYFELIMVIPEKTLSVCLARNEHTTSDPFISALEINYLEDSMYNRFNFTTNALATIARNQFGHGGQLISYPDDSFNRYWEPFQDNNPIVETKSNISSSDFLNLPPAKAFQKALTTSRGKELVIHWPAKVLPAANYYLALYFQDNRTPSPFSWRVFDVSVNDAAFYKGLNVSTAGVMVYATSRPLSGHTTIKLTPDLSSKVGPVINAGELFLVVPLSGRTVTRDVIVMEDLARSLSNRPADWSGDPCLPQKNSWTGVTCSLGKSPRIVSLNFTDYGVSGSLPKSINNLTALSSIFLGGNKISGNIPDMGSLKALVYLHLENNELSGSVPSSLGQLQNLKEIYFQNNKLDRQIPDSLKNRTGIIIQI